MIASLLKNTAIGALAGVALGASLAWPLAHARGHEAAAKKAVIVIKARTEETLRARGEAQECVSANAQYHNAVADQLRVINEELAANARRIAAAQRKSADAETRMLAASAAARDKASEAREAIRNAIDSCVNSGVPDDLVGLLNGILDSRPALSVNALPASAADH